MTPYLQPKRQVRKTIIAHSWISDHDATPFLQSGEVILASLPFYHDLVESFTQHFKGSRARSMQSLQATALNHHRSLLFYRLYHSVLASFHRPSHYHSYYIPLSQTTCRIMLVICFAASLWCSICQPFTALDSDTWHSLLISSCLLQL